MCPDSAGTPRKSFINLNECKSFTNQEGMLACEDEPPKVSPLQQQDAQHRVSNNNNEDLRKEMVERQHNAAQKMPPVKDISDQAQQQTSTLAANEENIPAGDYRDSCGGCRVLTNANILSCEECLNGEGEKKYSAIEIRQCKWFSNMDGVLTCTESSHVNEL